jgi:hypothetical protein
MDEIVNQVSQRTGLPPDQARAVVETVLTAVEQKLPGPAAAALEMVLGQQGGGGQGAGGQGAGGLLGGAGGLLKGLLGG